jgi:hypothetical protein
MNAGADKRKNMLPTDFPELNVLGPTYDYSNELITPGDIGVYRGGSPKAVYRAIRGVNYYMDSIAFGGPSTPFTNGMQFQHYGINYFLKTGQKCSNGADMWDYIELIPKGDALGKNVQRGMASIGEGIQLKGLAPGIIEDAKNALNPAPLIKPLFGSGYAKCKKVTKRVGDQYGKLKDVDGNPWVDPREPVQQIGGLPYQTKWVFDKDIDYETFKETEKTQNPDGTDIVETENEEFRDFLDEIPLPKLLMIATGLLIANIAVYKYRY